LIKSLQKKRVSYPIKFKFLFSKKTLFLRCLELENELRKLRNDVDAALRAKDEDSAVVKKKLIVEIETLSVRLQETESR